MIEHLDKLSDADLLRNYYQLKSYLDLSEDEAFKQKINLNYVCFDICDTWKLFQQRGIKP